MRDPLFPQGYVALALIKAKIEIFNESFATRSELNQFTTFIQKEFIKRQLCVSIVRSLDREDFNVKESIITINDYCRFDLSAILDDDISEILNDKSLILRFFLEYANKRLTILERLQQETSKSNTEEKTLSLGIPKESNTEI